MGGMDEMKDRSPALFDHYLPFTKADLHLKDPAEERLPRADRSPELFDKFLPFTRSGDGTPGEGG